VHYAKGDGIIDAYQDNRKGGAGTFGGEGSQRPAGDQHGDAGAYQLLDDGGQPLRVVIGPAIENINVVAVGPAERGETSAEHVEKAMVLLLRSRLDKADARDLDLSRNPMPSDSGRPGKQQ